MKNKSTFIAATLVAITIAGGTIAAKQTTQAPAPGQIFILPTGTPKDIIHAPETQKPPKKVPLKSRRQSKKINKMPKNNNNFGGTQSPQTYDEKVGAADLTIGEISFTNGDIVKVEIKNIGNRPSPSFVVITGYAGVKDIVDDWPFGSAGWMPVNGPPINGIAGGSRSTIPAIKPGEGFIAEGPFARMVTQERIDEETGKSTYGKTAKTDVFSVTIFNFESKIGMSGNPIPGAFVESNYENNSKTIPIP